MEDGTFTGFGAGAQRFLFELSANNRKEWWDANIDRYRSEIQRPALQFVEVLGARLAAARPDLQFNTKTNGSGSLMRPYRDVRFSPDKSPYKEQVGIVFWIGPGKKVEMPCFYFHIGIDEVFFFAGQYTMPKAILERYRDAVAAQMSGGRLESILASLPEDVVVIPDPEYKRVPRGFPADHPRETHLRRKGLGISKTVPEGLLVSEGLVDFCLAHAENAAPLMDWLAEING